MSLKAQSWTIEATQALLALWGKENVKKQIKKSAFESIAQSLQSLGYEFNWKQCRTRVRNLTYYYRKAIRENAGDEKRKSTFQFFSELDRIYNSTEEPNTVMLIKSAEDMYDEGSEEESDEPAVQQTLRIQEPPAQDQEILLSGDPRHPVVVDYGRPSQEEHSEQIIMLQKQPASVDLDELLRPSHLTETCADGPSSFEERSVGTASEDDDTRPSERLLSHKKTLREDETINVLAVLQERAEEREDARQLRLLEHEKRMEDRRMRWEERRRERELECMQKWVELREEREEERRREGELRHQQWEEERREREHRREQQLVRMFLEGLDKMQKRAKED